MEITRWTWLNTLLLHSCPYLRWLELYFHQHHYPWCLWVSLVDYMISQLVVAHFYYLIQVIEINALIFGWGQCFYGIIQSLPNMALERDLQYIRRKYTMKTLPMSMMSSKRRPTRLDLFLSKPYTSRVSTMITSYGNLSSRKNNMLGPLYLLIIILLIIQIPTWYGIITRSYRTYFPCLY